MSERVAAAPLVSVIIPCYNNEEYLRECISSAFNQTLAELEIICIDDGSTDGSLAIMKSFEARCPSRVRVIAKPNEGFGATINRGIEEARGRYVAILESDDYVEPDMYERLYACATEQGFPDAIRSDFDRFVNGGGGEYVFERARLSDDESLWNKPLNPKTDQSVFNLFVLMQPTLVKRSFLLEKKIRLNESPGASYQDNGYWFQVSALADSIYYLAESFYHLRRDNPNSSMLSKGKADAIRSEYDFIRCKMTESADCAVPNALVLCARARFVAYWGTFNRIDPSLRKSFVSGWSDDFHVLLDAGELDEGVFSDFEWQKLQMILDDPDRFYYEQEFWVKDWTSLNDEIRSLRSEIAKLQKENQGLRSNSRKGLFSKVFG